MYTTSKLKKNEKNVKLIKFTGCSFFEGTALNFNIYANPAELKVQLQLKLAMHFLQIGDDDPTRDMSITLYIEQVGTYKVMLVLKR